MAVSSARFMVCLSGCDFFSICIYGRVGPWVDFGCSQDGVACDKGAVRVDLFFYRSTPRDTGGYEVGCSGKLSWVWKSRGPCMLV